MKSSGSHSLVAEAKVFWESCYTNKRTVLISGAIGMLVGGYVAKKIHDNNNSALDEDEKGRDFPSSDLSLGWLAGMYVGGLHFIIKVVLRL